jgi:transposase InsO family protein
MSDQEYAGSLNGPKEERPCGGEPGGRGGWSPGDLPAPPDDDGGDAERSPARLVGPRRGGGGRVRRTVAPGEIDLRRGATAKDRLYLLDLWTRSSLPATEFSRLVGVAPHTLYEWRRKFVERGPAGLENRPKGAPKGSRVPEPTRRAVLLMKEAHPEWGVDRLHDMLLRTDGFQVSAEAIGLVLREEGYVVAGVPVTDHDQEPKRFERARPNCLWQTDLFTFVLKRENRRVYLVAFEDDQSRFITGYGLHASSGGALVREVFEAAVANYGVPEEVLSDQGPQYHTWRGKSAFTKLLEKRGVKHILAAPHHSATCGKIERFWGSLWRECVESAIFRGLEDARARVGHYIDYYNFQRPHQGIDGAVPADRFFSAAPEVKASLLSRVAANAAELARHGVPRQPFYLTGKIGETALSLHAEGEKVILLTGKGREEVDLTAGGPRAVPGEAAGMPAPLAPQGLPRDLPGEEDDAEEPPPGTSPLDGFLGTKGGDR